MIKIREKEDEEEYRIHKKNKHTTINETGYETWDLDTCKECIYFDIIKTNEEKLLEVLQAKEYEIECSKNLWDDSPYSERAESVIIKLANMRAEREIRSETRSIAIYDYQSKNEYVQNCRDKGYELPEYAQYL